MTIDVKLSPEHQATVDRMQLLSDELKNKAVGSGLTAAAKPLKKAMKRNSPIGKTKRLSESVNQLRLSARAANRLKLFGEKVQVEAGQLAILVGPNKKVEGKSRAKISNILEHGAKPHRIRPKTARGLLNLRGGLFARSVMHPGIKATKYIERSFNEAQGEIESGFFEGVSKRIDKLL